jgi:DNA-damage-inducible protein J
MHKSAIVHARIEPQTKKKAEAVLKELGLSPAEAIRLFYRQIDLRGGLPFPILIPNETTAKTLRKARKGEEMETFDSLDELYKNLER